MIKKDISLTLEEEELKPLRDADSLLNSPDLGLLKLASPELERLIIQTSGMGTAPGPTGHFVYPKPVTDEQEFAEGFVKALEDLHKQNQLSGGQVGGQSAVLELSLPPGQQPELPVYTTLSPYGGSVSFSAEPFPPVPLSPLKEEPQTVPDVQSFGDSPPLSPADPMDPMDPMDPVDPDSQERIKAERKRLRNRIAASKCRRRKLERISRLEDKVKSLKTQNTDLASTASVLRDQVQRLKQKVLTHVSSGCEVQVH